MTAEDILKGDSVNTNTAETTAIKKPSNLRFLIPLALLLTVGLIACNSSADGSSTNAFNDGSASVSDDLAPNFSITMFQGQDVVGGQEIALHDLVGERPIVLNFWAGLCPPCRAEMPDLQEFNEEFKDRTLVLGIDLGQFLGLGNHQEAENLLEELSVTYPAGFTPDASVARDYKVLGMPTTIFIDSDGKIFNKWTGALNGAVLEEKVLEMLAQ